MRLFLGILLLLVAASGSAEPFVSVPGYTMFLSGPYGARASEPITLPLTIKRHLGSSARDVVIEWTLPDLELVSIDERCAPAFDGRYRCVIDEIEAGTTDVLEVVVVAPAQRVVLTTSARLVSASPQSAPLVVDREIDVRAPVADLAMTIAATDGIDADGLATYEVTIEGRQPFVDPKSVRLEIASRFLVFAAVRAPDGWECVLGNDRLSCTIPAPAVGTSQTLLYRVRPTFPQGAGSLFTRLVWKDADFDEVGRADTRALVLYYEFDVTNGNDAGAGSLRNAIGEANAICSHPWAPCRIRFADGVIVRPESPLPVVEAQWIVIDGGRIDGSLLQAPANGLTLASSAGSAVRGLTIENVPGNALMLQAGGGRHVANCTLRNNAGRGIVATSARYTIVGNDIRGNDASGIFVLHGNGVLEDNRIEDNGATGVFFGGYAISTVTRNRIANNRQFGVALAALMQVDVVANEIVANGEQAIDIGLDGPSFAGLTDGLHAPVLTAAHYDANTDTTVIEGALDRPSFAYWFYYDIHLYADGQYLGTLDDVRKRTFRFRASGDLRGRAITANAIRETREHFSMRETTEMSETIAVQP